MQAISCMVAGVEILRILRQNIGIDDLGLSEVSSTMSHYSNLLDSHYGAKFYLTKNLPFYIVTCIAQTKLNYSIIYNRGTWHNLGMSDSVTCSFCGDVDSFPHIFTCPHTSNNLPLIAQQDPSIVVLS